MYSCAFLNFLYIGVSNFLHRWGPLSVFKMQLFVISAAAISREDLEFGCISCLEKLFNLRSKAVRQVTEMNLLNTVLSFDRFKFFILTYILRKAVRVLGGNRFQFCLKAVALCLLSTLGWPRLRALGSFEQKRGCSDLFERRYAVATILYHYWKSYTTKIKFNTLNKNKQYYYN